MIFGCKIKINHDHPSNTKIRREMDQLIPISNKSSHSAPIDVDVVNGD